MPCKDDRHAEHVRPTAPKPGRDKIIFNINNCERRCVYCRNRKIYKAPFSDARTLRKHVKRHHLNSGQYPRVTFENNIVVPRFAPNKASPEVFPVDLNLPPVKRLDALCTLLQIKPRFSELFRTLASQHLFNNYDLSQLYSPGEDRKSRDPLDPPAFSFLQTYGERLWPLRLSQRDHLLAVEKAAQLVKFWSFHLLVYEIDGKPRDSRLQLWREQHDNLKPNEEELVVMSKIGHVMKLYIAALVNAGAPASANTQESEEQVLNKIIGGARAAASSPPRVIRQPLNEHARDLEAGRDSSPEIPLRSVSRSRRRKPPASRSNSTIFPGLANRLSTVDDGQRYCVSDGCRYNRRTHGVMVACGSDQCPTEWFHPQCVQLEGLDLSTIEWRCRDCAATDNTSERHGQDTTDETSSSSQMCSNCGTADTCESNSSQVDSFLCFACALHYTMFGRKRSVEREGVVISVAPPTDHELSDGQALPPPNCASSISEVTNQTAPAESTEPPAEAPVRQPTAVSQQISIPTEQVADDEFIQSMQSCVATARLERPARAGSAGLASSLRSDESAAITNAPTFAVTYHYGQASMANSVLVRQSESLLQAQRSPKTPDTSSGGMMQSKEKHQQDLRDHMARLAWNSSSSGVRRALENINNLESSSLQCIQPKSVQTLPGWRHGEVRLAQQPPGSIPTATVVAAAPSLQYPPTHPCQPSQDMPPPPPRVSSNPQKRPMVQQLDPRRQPNCSGIAPSFQPRQFNFTPVVPLPPHLWILPTRETTFDTSASFEGELTEKERAKVQHYLMMTGGLGGLPVADQVI